MKQWLVESKSGMYSKTVIKEHQFEDAWTLGKEIAKAHPELAGEIKGGDVKKYQDNIFKYAGEMLQGAGVSLNMVRGLAMDPDWAMELVTATLDALGRENLEEALDDSIKVLRDLYYFDKLGLLAAKEDVDPKYYRYGTLWANKGDIIDNSMEEYDMITNSKRLKKGVDFTQGSLNELNPTALGAPQAAADAQFDKEEDQDSIAYQKDAEMEEVTINAPINKVVPAETGLSKYLDVLRAHDWFHHFSDDHRIWQRGQADKDNLKALYSTLAPNDKQEAMDAFIDKYLQVYKPNDFPGAANNVKYLTTDTFKGAI